MPYIKQEQRWFLEPILEPLLKLKISGGDLNYVITRLMISATGKNPSYEERRAVIADVHEAANEYRRRRMAPYEDRKIIENGDVYENS